MEEVKLIKTVEDVYVANLVDDTVILYGRNYDVLAQVPVHDAGAVGLVLSGVCLCQRWKGWSGEKSDAFWFCLSPKTSRRATAEIWSSGQVVMRQEGCGES